MILAKTILLLAALVSPNQPITVAVAVQPGAIKSRVAPFDPAMLRQALLRELAAAGIATGTSPDLPRLVVQVRLVDPGDVLALGQKAGIAADVQLLSPDRPGPKIIPTAVCAAQAKFGLLSTPGQRARLALARCIDQLAGQITASVAGSSDPVIVR